MNEMIIWKYKILFTILILCFILNDYSQGSEQYTEYDSKKIEYTFPQKYFSKTHQRSFKIIVGAPFKQEKSDGGKRYRGWFKYKLNNKDFEGRKIISEEVLNIIEYFKNQDKEEIDHRILVIFLVERGLIKEKIAREFFIEDEASWYTFKSLWQDCKKNIELEEEIAERENEIAELHREAAELHREAGELNREAAERYRRVMEAMSSEMVKRGLSK
jgi:hypothetical protein